jgi:ABC-2 type transport system ATP-binding protein
MVEFRRRAGRRGATIAGNQVAADDLPALVVSGLVKRYGAVTALAGLSMELHRGEVFGLLGPNGAGKTTCVSVVAGLLQPDAGEVTVFGRRLGEGDEARGLVGLTPQEVGLYESLTVRQNLAFFAALQDVVPARREDEVHRVARLFLVEELLDRRCRTLSGGERHRVHAAAGVAGGPPLLLLDEPTAGVDLHARDAILAGIRALAAEGVAVVYTTHYIEEAERICDRVAILLDGQIVDQGRPRDLAAGVQARVEVRFDGDGHTLRQTLGAAVLDWGSDLLVVETAEPGPFIVALVKGDYGAITVQDIHVVGSRLESYYRGVVDRARRSGADGGSED